MSYLREHPLAATAIAYALATAAVVAMAGAWGFSRFARAWSSVRPGWLALAIGAEVLTIPAYVLAYRAIAGVHGGPKLDPRLVLRLVAAGFGPFVLGGGFVLDKRALHAIVDDEHAATTRVLGLGALEWAVLAPAAWICAVVLLVVGDHRPLPSLLWPWAIAVPVGFAAGFWLATPARAERLCRADGRIRSAIGRTLGSVGLLFTLARDLRAHLTAWVGAGLYWALDIASFFGAAAFIGLHLNLGELVLGYATGYALTRRSLPLGGAGATEVLMTLSLHWVGQPVAPALAAVVVYRVFNFLLPTVPALAARRDVEHLLDEADRTAGGLSPSPSA